MDIPFYISFKDFKDNYQTDLEKWLNIYPDGNEDEFLKDAKDLYLPFLRWSGKYFFKDLEQLQDKVVTYDNNDGYTIILTDDLKIYVPKKHFKNLKYALPKIVNHIEYIINIKKNANAHFVGRVNPKTGEIIPLKGKPPYDLSDDFTDDPTQDQPTTQEDYEDHEKITINGSLQLIGHIFTKLIEKGYIEPKRKNGKPNASATAEMLLNHFNFTYNTNGTQPTKEYLKKTLFEQNRLSADKTDLIKIPHLKKLID